MRLVFFLFLILCAEASAQRNILSDYKHTINYPDHKAVFQLQETGAVRKAIHPTKKYYWVSSNQIKVTQGGYSGKLLDGTYEEYYLNKNLKEKGKFYMGLKIGEWSNWYEKGVLRSKTHFIDGTLSGRFFKYDTLGMLIEEGKYKNGLLHGKLKRTVSKDSVQTSNYRDGVQIVRAKQPWFQKLLFWRKNKLG